MKLLALDTATENLSVALWLDGEIVERSEVAGREHSARLPALLDAVLAEAGITLRQLDGLVCGIGPGSFAGVRIGVSYVKGLALGLELPVAPVSSLAMLAQAALRKAPEAVALAAIDARMGEIYFGCYRMEADVARPCGQEWVCPPDRCAVLEPSALSADIGVGTGWAAHAAALAKSGIKPGRIDGAALPQAADALRLVAHDFSAQAGDAAMLVPTYLRNRVALTKIEQIAARAASASSG